MEEKIKELEARIIELEKHLRLAEKDIKSLYYMNETLVKTIEIFSKI